MFGKTEARFYAQAC